jgi:ATP-dependent Clp protease ATP-binding subunit ClpX
MSKDTAILCCNFCGKLESQVLTLIAGPGVHICNECAELAHEVCSEDSPAALKKKQRKALAYLKRILKRNSTLYTFRDQKSEPRVLVIHRGEIIDISDPVIRFFPKDKVNINRIEDLSAVLFGSRWGLKRRKL